MINYKQVKESVVVHAVSKRFVLVNTLISRMVGFESLKRFYYMDSNFKDTFVNLSKGKRVDRYQIIDGFFVQRRSSMYGHELIKRVICQRGS